jgi:uncharacterized linocin/CFP29 family protein
MDFLGRDEAPLNNEQWEKLDNIVTDTIRNYIAGRRFISLYGPLGAGMPAVFMPELSVSDNEPVMEKGTKLVEFKELQQDFIMTWKSFETSSRMGIPVDWAVAAAAAYQFALKEDREIFKTILEAEGKLSLKAGDWTEAGGVLCNITGAISKMVSLGHIGPYALLMSPASHAMVYRFFGNNSIMEIKVLEELMKSGVFITTHLSDNQLLLVETGSMNMDLALGMDVRTAYVGPEDMNHRFRILETVVLRIKRPSSICLIKK